ncbi:hypothetical protein AVEN_177199-1 [Araneus ventricosus]|uniref:Uncharacterized protein n=1 Tax=Araneus ventricosus TaxID=182803 RepID=A0A4Y2LRW8_ARAVE|nr:hypothetical protein AVEN_177199-1 [Araneus ventricosus]
MPWIWRSICYGTLSANPRRHDEESQGSDILTVQRGNPAGQTTALFINSNCRFAFRCNGSEADIRISKPDVGIQKKPQLKIYLHFPPHAS